MRSPGRALWTYAGPYRLRYAAGILCLLGGTLCSLGIPWTVRRAIEALQTTPAAAPVALHATLVLLLALGNGLCRLGSRFTIVGAAQAIEYDVRRDLYRSLQAYPPRFYAGHPIGDLMSRASSDVAAIKMLAGFGTVTVVGTALAFVGALSAMIAVDPRLTLVALSPAVILVVLARRFTGVVHARTLAAQEQLGALSALVQEHLAGMSVVRAYTMETVAAAAFERENAELLRRSQALGRTQAEFTPLAGLLTGVAVLLVLWVGGGEVAAGRLGLGSLVAFNGYLAYLAWPTLALGLTLSMGRRGLTSMARVLEIVDHAPAPEPPGEPLHGPWSLVFEDLTFAYAGRGPVLRGVSFEVRPGETVAVVGRTGSGKSTLGLLLARLWDPPPGTVFVAGRDATSVPRRALREAIGYVPQEGFLFSRSLAENVDLGRAAVDARARRAAAAAAGVLEDIEQWPEAWGTVVGERGLTLSGGQRQRVTLARALAGTPPVLVLDDVFASVDAVKEEEIVANLRGHRARGTTVLLMTHRLRAARAADRIIVLDEGRVVETGTHEALLAHGEAYARLWHMQQLEEEIARA